MALRHGLGRGGGDRGGVLQAALKHVHLPLVEQEALFDILDGLGGVEALAGEDVHPDVAAVGKGMDRDMALGDEDEAGDAPVLGFAAYVSAYMGRRDLGHPYLRGAGVQERAHEVFVGQLLRVTTVSVNGNVHQSPLSVVVPLARSL